MRMGRRGAAFLAHEFNDLHSFAANCSVAHNLQVWASVQAVCCGRTARSEVRKKMLWTIFVILLVLWLLGMITSYTLGGFIHILLVIALVVLVIQLISGRRPVV
jgi:asparagine N-glycosylation enzyme membrane subunit Stt3